MRQNWFFLPQRWEGRQLDLYQDRIFTAIEITFHCYAYLQFTKLQNSYRPS